jgi:hypothetical protein
MKFHYSETVASMVYETLSGCSSIIEPEKLSHNHLVGVKATSHRGSHDTLELELACAKWCSKMEEFIHKKEGFHEILLKRDNEHLNQIAVLFLTVLLGLMRSN